MKNVFVLLALGSFAVLPACTIHYYGNDPGVRGPRRSSGYNGPDADQGTVITQPGTVGGPGNAGSYPPVRTGGTRPPTAPTPPAPPVRTGGTRPPTAATPPPIRTGSGGQGPVRSGGTGAGTMTPAPSPAPAPAPTASGGSPMSPPSTTKDPLYGTGGIKGPHPVTPAQPVPTRHDEEPVNATTKDPLYGTGGIKGPHPTSPSVPGGNPGGTMQEPGATTKDPLYGTGGIKGPHPTSPQPGPTRHDEEPENPTTKDPLYGTGGIKGPHPVPGEQPTNPGPVKGGPAFVFSKSPCLGPCPSYTATVWADGRVLYNGQLNVPRIGTFKLKLDPATVAMLLKQAEEMGFAELKDQYASGATDIPATTLTIYQADGRSKTVVVEDNAPDEVNALFGNVASVIGSVADGGNEERREK